MFATHINVAFVEDDPETHARLMAALVADPELRVVFATNAAKPMLQWLVGQLDKDELCVLLVDLGLPDLHGLEVIRICKAMSPKTEIMVITMFGDETNMIRAFEAGASGYLLKDGNELELAQHVRTLRQGGSPMSPIIARQLLSRMGGASRPSPPLNVTPPYTGLPSSPVAVKANSEGFLTEREEQVLQFLSHGYSYGELAKKMGVTINTIQTHIKGLYTKLEVHSKSQAIYEARQRGLLEK